MDDGLIATQNGESTIVVKHLESEPVAIEGDASPYLPDGHCRNGLRHRHHRRISP
jgi:hypothetical protein